MPQSKYDEDFKKSIVALYHSNKSQSQISKDYDVYISTISRWIKLYSEVNHALRFQHSISTLCRVLRVNRSTYYKHFYQKTSERTLQNQKIRAIILAIYSASKKRFFLLLQ